MSSVKGPANCMTPSSDKPLAGRFSTIRAQKNKSDLVQNASRLQCKSICQSGTTFPTVNIHGLPKVCPEKKAYLTLASESQFRNERNVRVSARVTDHYLSQTKKNICRPTKHFNFISHSDKCLGLHKSSSGTSFYNNLNG